MMTDDTRAYLLVARASHWVNVIRHASASRRFGRQDVLRAVEMHMFGAHVTALALAHLNQCLDHARRTNVELGRDLKPLTATFKEYYRLDRVRELRHALEHEEDRIAGRNLRSNQAYGRPLVSTPTIGHDDDRLVHVRVLGEEFNISRCIDAALELRVPLIQLATRNGAPYGDSV